MPLGEDGVEVFLLDGGKAKDDVGTIFGEDEVKVVVIFAKGCEVVIKGIVGVPWHGGRKDVKSCTAQGTNAVQIKTKKRRNALKTIKLLNICSGDKMLIFNGFVLYFDVC